MVSSYLRHVLHVLRGAEVLAEVHLLELEQVLVNAVHVLAAGEGVVLRRVHVPWEEARRDRDLVVHGLDLRHGHREREQRREDLVAVGVLEVEALLHLLSRLVEIAALGKELGVAARAVAVGHDVAENEDVLRLSDHRLEVARVVA